MSVATEPINVAVLIEEMAKARPQDRAVVCAVAGGGYEQYTFEELSQASSAAAYALEKLGICRGMRTVLMVRPSLDFFSLTFALFKIGAVIVLIDPGIGRKNLGKCIAEAEPEAFIGIPLAHAARVVFGWGRKTLRTLVGVGLSFPWCGKNLRSVMREDGAHHPIADVQGEETVAILFTSGSTGPPKGAVYSHGVFSAQVRYLRENFGLRPGQSDLATFPLFALFDPALGVTAVVPEMDASRPGKADPENLMRAIRDHKVTQMFGSPALIERLAQHGETSGARIDSIRRVISAGAPVRADLLRRFRKMLPDDAEIVTPYGATEALPVACIESREILDGTEKETATGCGICVGKLMPNMMVRIIRITDEKIGIWSEDLLAKDGKIGEIAVSGPVVTREYYGHPDMTAQAKILCADGRFFHRMGDVGRIDAEGRLWFCGRKNHRVETEHGTLFTIPCEAIFNQHEASRRSALVGIGSRGRQEPVICIELVRDKGRIDEAQLTAELLALGAKHEHTREIKKVLFHPEFPVDVRHNAKIAREQLAIWAETRLR